MLIFFHLYWFDIKQVLLISIIFCHCRTDYKYNVIVNLLFFLFLSQDIADHSQYLNKISTLLNVYIDMELKISMEKKTSSHIRDSSKIAAKILAALYIYLSKC